MNLDKVYVLLIFWVSLMVVSRFGSIVPIILYGLTGYERHLLLNEEFQLLFYLFPIVIFLQSWLPFQKSYKCKAWIVYSFCFCSLLSFVFSETHKLDQSWLNNKYLEQYQHEYNYIDSEFARAKETYDLEFDQQTITTLKKWKTESAVEQVAAFRDAFKREGKVSLDTIILERMALHNLKTANPYFTYHNSLKNWHFALPSEIHKQISQLDEGDPRIKELFLLLAEEVEIFNSRVIDWGEWHNHTNYDRRRSQFKRNELSRIPYSLYIDLCEVLGELKSDNDYKEHHSVLPTLKDFNKGFSNHRGSHEMVDLVISRMADFELQSKKVYVEFIGQEDSIMKALVEKRLTDESEFTEDEKQLITQYLSKPVEHYFNRVELSRDSRLVLDNTDKSTDEELILIFNSFTSNKSKNLLCTVLSVIYKKEDRDILSGGYVELLIGQLNGCNWEIKKSVRLVTY